jgi:hypothetical protein
VWRAGAIMLLLATVAPAQAQQGYDCHDGHVTSDPAALRPGLVVGRTARNHFYSGTDVRKDCPGAGAVCRRKGYVVPGDKLIVAAEEQAPGFVCAAFVNRRGNVSAGWLPAAAVDVQPAPKPPLTSWLGKWNYLNSNIAIARGKQPGSLDIEGDSWSKRYQSVNEGVISGEAIKPDSNTLAFASSAGETIPIEKADKTDCVLAFALVHDVLVVEDNGNCGGAGVYFTGFYHRKR